jgi:hypothetical protein
LTRDCTESLGGPKPFTRNPTAEGFETLRDPEPAALSAGICWRFSGTIGSIQAPRNSLVCLSVIVEQVGGTPNQVVDVYLGVGEETRRSKWKKIGRLWEL